MNYYRAGVGPDDDDFAFLLEIAEPGDIIFLTPGEYQVPDGTVLDRVSLIGEGRPSKIDLYGALRVVSPCRLSNFTLHPTDTGERHPTLSIRNSPEQQASSSGENAACAELNRVDVVVPPQATAVTQGLVWINGGRAVLENCECGVLHIQHTVVNAEDLRIGRVVVEDRSIMAVTGTLSVTHLPSTMEQVGLHNEVLSIAPRCGLDADLLLLPAEGEDGVLNAVVSSGVLSVKAVESEGSQLSIYRDMDAQLSFPESWYVLNN